MQQFFPHERQRPYQMALEWAAWVSQFKNRLNTPSPLLNQLSDLSCTIPVYLAEGLGGGRTGGHHDPVEKARDAILASSALLDLIEAVLKVDPERTVEAKRVLSQLFRQVINSIQAANTAEVIRSKLALPD